MSTDPSPEAVHALGRAVLLAPVLGVVFVAFGIWIITRELELLGDVRRKYRELQKALGIVEHRKTGLSFTHRVLGYLWLLLMGALGNCYFVYVLWLPAGKP